MGSRPSSYLGYGIAWGEGEERDECNTPSDESLYELIDEIDKHPEICGKIWAHEETACLFIFIGETYNSNDWDQTHEVDVSKFQGIEKHLEYDKQLKELCDKLKLNWKQPTYQLLSYYG